MKIAWFSNAPWLATGYGQQTALMVPELVRLGHDVAIFANCGLEGGILSWNGVPVYPRSVQQNPNGFLQSSIKHFGADIVLSLFCAWLLDESLMGSRWVPWAMIDREPAPDLVFEKIRKSYQPITCSQFGQRVAHKAGIDTLYVPLAVDTSVYRPTDKRLARQALNLPEDAFVVGIVADNKGYPCRKAIPQEIEAFAAFHAEYPESILLMHTCIDQGRGAADLRPLIKHLGIQGAVRVSDQALYGLGFEREHLVRVYNAIDVLLNVSMDEGFGLTMLEAQACGTPVIAGEWTAMGELVFGASKAIRRTDAEPWWNPTGGYQYLAHVDIIQDMITECYLDRHLLPMYADALVQGASAYEVRRVADDYLGPALGVIEERLQGHPALAEVVGK